MFIFVFEKQKYFLPRTRQSLPQCREAEGLGHTQCWGSSDMWTQELAVVFTGPMRCYRWGMPKAKLSVSSDLVRILKETPSGLA